LLDQEWSVESPRSRAASWGEFPIKFTSGEIDGNHFTTGCWLRFVVRTFVSCLKICRRRMRHMAVVLRLAVTGMPEARVLVTTMFVFVSSMLFH